MIVNYKQWMSWYVRIGFGKITAWHCYRRCGRWNPSVLFLSAWTCHPVFPLLHIGSWSPCMSREWINVLVSLRPSYLHPMYIQSGQLCGPFCHWKGQWSWGKDFACRGTNYPSFTPVPADYNCTWLSIKRDCHDYLCLKVCLMTLSLTPRAKEAITTR